MVALYTLFYNFIRTHSKLRMSPAMAAGIATTFLTFEDVLARIGPERGSNPEARPLPGARRLTYRLGNLIGRNRMPMALNMHVKLLLVGIIGDP